MKELRPYQKQQLWQVFRALDYHDAVILQSPTGTGKGVQMSYIFDQCLKNNKRVWFIVYGRLVVDTFCAELKENDIPYTPMMAGRSYQHESKAVVASISTLNSWYFKKGHKHSQEALCAPDYILIDECRKITSESCINILKFFQDKGSKLIGFDATPKSKNLGRIYQDIVLGEFTPWHIEQGNLTPVIHYAPAVGEEEYMEALQNIRKRGNDYVEKDLKALESSRVLIGDVVTNYERISAKEFGRLGTFAIACISRNHARSVQHAFLEAGHKVEYIDGTTSEEDRARIFQELESGAVLGVVSVLVLIYGVNIPFLEIGILARPTKDVTTLLQFGGRILRLHQKKEKVLFIDHTRALLEIGYLDDEYMWALDESECVNETRKKKAEQKEKENVDIVCKACGHMFSNSPACPKCSEPAIIKYDDPNVVYYNTDLIRQKQEEKTMRQLTEERKQFASELKTQLTTNYGDAYHKKLNKFNEIYQMKYQKSITPEMFDQIDPAEFASEATKRYIKYVNIRKYYRRF